MSALIVLIVFSLGVAYFATQNTGLVHIVLGSYLIQAVPLYVIVIGSLLMGIFISWLISLVDSFASAFVMHGKDHEIKKMQEKIDTLHEENHDLEIEIAHIKGESESIAPSEFQKRMGEGKQSSVRQVAV